MKCKKCGAKIRDGALFCRECGTKVEAEPPKKKFCRECGKPLGEGVKFCPECGTKVDIDFAKDIKDILEVPKQDLSEIKKAEDIKETKPEEESDKGETDESEEKREKEKNEFDSHEIHSTLDALVAESKGQYVKPKKKNKPTKKNTPFENIATILAIFAVITFIVGIFSIDAELIVLSTVQFFVAGYALNAAANTDKKYGNSRGRMLLAIAILLFLVNFVSCMGGSEEIDDEAISENSASSAVSDPESTASSIEYDKIKEEINDAANSVVGNLAEIYDEATDTFKEASGTKDNGDTANVTRPQKNGFDAATNDSYGFSQYTIAIPSYFYGKTAMGSAAQWYAEAGEKSAMLQISASEDSDENYPVTFDGLMQDNDGMIDAIESSMTSEVLGYEVLDTGTVKGILYEFKLKETSERSEGTGEWFVFPSEEDRSWCNIIFSQTNNTEYDYTDDIDKIIASITAKSEEDASSKSDVKPSSTTANSESKANNGVILPRETSKLGRDYDSSWSGGATYINVDAQRNVPKTKSWGKYIVTDSVAEYLNELEKEGCKIAVTSTDYREPYAGFKVYDTYFKVTNGKTSWSMYCGVQSELFVEYELDINY